MDLLDNSIKETNSRITTLKTALKEAEAKGLTSKNSEKYRMLQREIANAEMQLRSFQRQQKLFGSVGLQQVGALGKKYQQLGAKISAVGSAMASTITMWSAVGIYAGKKLIDLSNEQALQEQKLTEIYRTRLKEGEKNVKQTERLASALQEQGVVGDEVALAFSQQMATFSKSSKTVNTLLPAFENLLVQQKGLNGTTQDAVNLGNMFGKVMTGQVGALKRVGISFDESQEKILKFGTEEEKASILAEVITQNVGNMNSELAKTDAGKIQQAKNQIGDFGERIGAVLLPAVASAVGTFQKDFMPTIDKVIKIFEKYPALGKFALNMAMFGAVITPVVFGVGKLVSGIGGLMSLITTVVPMLNAPVLIIAGITAGLITLYKTSDKFRNAVNNAISQIKTSFVTLWTALKPAISELGGALIPLVSKGLNVIGGAVAKLLPIITKTITTSINRITTTINIINKLFSTIKKVGGGIYNALASPFTKVSSKISSVVNSIKSKLSALKNYKWLKAPHLRVSGGSAPFGIGGKGTKPNISIDWYAKAMKNGMILNSPTIFGEQGGKLLGGGEVGSETVVGTNSLMNMISTAVASTVNQLSNNIASAIATGMQVAVSGATVNGGGTTIDVYLFKNGEHLGKTIVNTYDTYKKRLG